MSLLRINNNIAALNTQRNLNVNSFNLSKSLQKLSSGFRINVAADGPADLVISEGLRSQIGGLKAAIRNSQEAANYVGIAEGALKEVSDLLVSMRALAVHAANTGVVTADQIAADQAELNNAIATIERIALTTRFAGERVLDVGNNTSKIFHIGEGATNADQVSFVMGFESGVANYGLMEIQEMVSIAALDTAALSLGAAPGSAIARISAGIGHVAELRGKLGAFQKNTLQTNINSLSVALENVTATESFIRDTNMAEETSAFTKNQILVQAGISVLAQANVASQSVLALLR